MAQYRIILVEDEPETLARLKRVVEQEPSLDLLAACNTYAKAQQAIRTHEFDLLLTDLNLPDGHGNDLIRMLADKPATQAMVVTVFGDEKHVVDAIRAGATGYLLKDGSAEHIVDGIHDLMEGGSPISPAIARFLLKQLQVDTAGAASPDPQEDAPRLTAREKDVLRYVAKGFTYSEIAGILFISVHTVTSHVKHIYKKLSVGSRGEAVYEAMQLGLLQMSGEESV